MLGCMGMNVGWQCNEKRQNTISMLRHAMLYGHECCEDKRVRREAQSFLFFGRYV